MVDAYKYGKCHQYFYQRMIIDNPGQPLRKDVLQKFCVFRGLHLHPSAFKCLLDTLALLCYRQIAKYFLEFVKSISASLY